MIQILLDIGRRMKPAPVRVEEEFGSKPPFFLNGRNDIVIVTKLTAVRRNFENDV